MRCSATPKARRCETVFASQCEPQLATNRSNLAHHSPDTPTMKIIEAEIGRIRFRFAGLIVEWFDGGGFTSSHVVWRVRGRVVAIVAAGQA